MLFRITFVSDESDRFLREITIDADATFLDLNKAILDACDYSDDQFTSFYTCTDDWEQKDQITREDMGTSASDQDVYIMEKAILRDFITDEEQKLVFIFDTFNDRAFYLKINEIIPSKHLREAKCTRSEGKAPEQITIEAVPTAHIASAGAGNYFDEGDDLYGDCDSFDQDELDLEGFEIEEH